MKLSLPRTFAAGVKVTRRVAGSIADSEPRSGPDSIVNVSASPSASLPPSVMTTLPSSSTKTVCDCGTGAVLGATTNTPIGAAAYVPSSSVAVAEIE